MLVVVVAVLGLVERFGVDPEVISCLYAENNGRRAGLGGAMDSRRPSSSV